jgi:DNA repair protein RecN (Recombination protein N)
MLLSLYIENFALIDQLELNFQAGLTVLTGETGAGKSIILDAIDVVLGGKINSRLIRSGSKKSKIEGVFLVSHSLKQWLEDNRIKDLDTNKVVFSRELIGGGVGLRSRSKVNGLLVNRTFMSQLREQLVEITAQGQTIELMIPERQRALLDNYGGEILLEQLKKVQQTYEISQNAKHNLEKRQQQQQQQLQRLDFIRYQLKELDEAQLTHEKELDELEQQRDRLSHIVELQQSSYQAYQLLYQNDLDTPAIADLLGNAESILINMVDYDRQLEPILEMVQSAITQVVEAGQQINSYGDNLEADPQTLEETEQRIRILKNLCRKYGSTLKEVIIYYENLQQELTELTDEGQSIEELEKQYEIAQEKLIKICQKLTILRQNAAEKLEQQLIEELKPLGMEKVKFQCRLTPCFPNGKGAETIAFYFSPNQGEEVQPLAIIASGGEMTRFLLALKSCFTQAQQTPKTLIFDEIDAGVSGKVAQAIASKLHQLSFHHQVLCVTHQPLVAAMADGHFRVDKQTIENPFLDTENSKNTAENSLLLDEDSALRTVIRVKSLEKYQNRRDELAELTGGHCAQDAIAFAESLLAQAQAQRSVMNKPN